MFKNVCGWFAKRLMISILYILYGLLDICKRNSVMPDWHYAVLDSKLPRGHETTIKYLYVTIREWSRKNHFDFIIMMIANNSQNH